MDIEYELSVKRLERNVLRVELEDAELWESAEYQRILKRIATLEAKLDRRNSTAVESGVTSQS